AEASTPHGRRRSSTSPTARRQHERQHEDIACRRHRPVQSSVHANSTVTCHRRTHLPLCTESNKRATVAHYQFGRDDAKQEMIACFSSSPLPTVAALRLAMRPISVV